MGSYSHNAQRFLQPDGTVQKQGNMDVAVKPSQIPYRVQPPKKQQIETSSSP